MNGFSDQDDLRGDESVEQGRAIGEQRAVHCLSEEWVSLATL
jgi:hypothetical protein